MSLNLIWQSLVWVLQRLHPLHATNELLLLSELLIDNVALGSYSRKNPHHLEVQIFVSFQLFEDVHRFLLELCVLGLSEVIQKVYILTILLVFTAARTIRANDVLPIEVEKEPFVFIELHLMVNLGIH